MFSTVLKFVIVAFYIYTIYDAILNIFSHVIGTTK